MNSDISNLSAQVNSLPADKLQEIQKAIELFSVGQGPAKTMEEATRRSYQFWDTQPVPKLGGMARRSFTSASDGNRMQTFPSSVCVFVNEVWLSLRGDGDIAWLH